MEELYVFKRRLNKIGIEVELIANYPWVYINKVNGKKVTEKYKSEYGFTVAFMSIREDKEVKFTDLNVIFKLIRKYIN